MRNIQLSEEGYELALKLKDLLTAEGLDCLSYEHKQAVKDHLVLKRLSIYTSVEVALLVALKEIEKNGTELPNTNRAEK